MKAELFLPVDKKDIPAVKISLYVLTGSKCWAREYIDGLEGHDKSKLLALLDRIVKHGPPTNIEKFKPLDDGIFEIKSYQDRLPCFYDKNKRNSLVITHGLKKKSQKLPKGEIERAKALRKAYYAEE